MVRNLPLEYPDPSFNCPLEPLSHAVTSLFFPVSLGFFDDILIPPESLQQPAKLYPPKLKWVTEELRPLQRMVLTPGGGPGPVTGCCWPLPSPPACTYAPEAPIGLCFPRGPWCPRAVPLWAVRPGCVGCAVWAGHFHFRFTWLRLSLQKSSQRPWPLRGLPRLAPLPSLVCKWWHQPAFEGVTVRLLVWVVSLCGSPIVPVPALSLLHWSCLFLCILTATAHREGPHPVITVPEVPSTGPGTREERQNPLPGLQLESSMAPHVGSRETWGCPRCVGR